MSNLTVRILTALIGGAIFGFLMFCCYEGFAVLFLVLNFFGLKEFYSLLFKQIKVEAGDDDSESDENDFTDKPQAPLENRTAALTFMLSGTIIYLLALLSLFISPWFLVGLSGFFIYFIIQHNKAAKQKQDLTLVKKIIGFVYITWPFILLTLIAFYNNEGLFKPLSVLGIFLIIWSNDVMAYFIGKRFGKTPLASKISPKKTVEGFAGGLLGSLTMAAVLVFVIPAIAWHWLAIGLIIGLFGPLGDLLESALKRKAGIKDSGSILPGHGGVLDRFDAFFLSAPFVFIYLLLFV